jgi:acyl-CoA thioester hydrolase
VNEFAWPVRVYYEDTDLGGVVYYANYLKFMERARTEWLRSAGIEQDELIRELDVIFAVRNIEIEYLQPARFNDQLRVSIKLIEIRKASLILAQEITKENDNGVLCKGIVKIASLRASTFKPCAIPPSLNKLIRIEET